ncbi:hypothetical protein GC096_30555 [Paenibacillus sp. LMG 31461]|uniref:DUF3899 domain-containing protein n=1 Tax=Paenibacillus plantarum TaxID=2654975 RepID=A0ABX1XK53_9BACL|nr:hypothetical protein [Paenibacillus plantarum]NOU68371.1 hypothetical protein [Paenibacillus plantarum]
MTSYKFRPFLSLIGFCIFIFTILVIVAFRLATDPGSKMLLSTFSAVLSVFTLLWGIMGVIELISLIKKANRMKADYKNEQISREEYRRGRISLKVCFIANVSYLVIFSFQLWYVISNWDTFNV